MLAEKYIPKYTVEDYRRWEGNWELIEGFPFAKAPSPFGIHQKISGKIITALNNELEKCQSKEISAYVELDWIVNDTTVVRPDISLTCKEVKEFIKEPPEVIFEVVSKNTVLKDEELKFELYKKEGVKYYILVYPDIQKVRGFKLENKEYEKFFDGDEGEMRLDLCEKCNVVINVEKIFK